MSMHYFGVRPVICAEHRTRLTTVRDDRRVTTLTGGGQLHNTQQGHTKPSNRTDD